MEALVGVRTATIDPFLDEVEGWGCQALQPHQRDVIASVAALHKLQPCDAGLPLGREGAHHHDAPQPQATTPVSSPGIDTAELVARLAQVPEDRRQSVLASLMTIVESAVSGPA